MQLSGQLHSFEINAERLVFSGGAFIVLHLGQTFFVVRDLLLKIHQKSSMILKRLRSIE